MSTISLTILRLLADPTHFDHDQIAEQAGIERSTLGAQLRHLASKALICRPRGEDWTPTTAGLALVSERPAPAPAARSASNWSNTDQALCALDEHPEGLTNGDVAKAMGIKPSRVGGLLRWLGERGGAVKIGGYGGKWYAAWHAPEVVTA